jgi:hypothetical protein
MHETFLGLRSAQGIKEGLVERKYTLRKVPFQYRMTRTAVSLSQAAHFQQARMLVACLVRADGEKKHGSAIHI